VKRSKIRAGAVFAALLLAVLAGCKDSPTRPSPVAGVVPDFSLTDVNSNSPTATQAVSPRQQLGNISAWYFGHAT
jgi:hypothetical protein